MCRALLARYLVLSYFLAPLSLDSDLFCLMRGGSCPEVDMPMLASMLETANWSRDIVLTRLEHTITCRGRYGDADWYRCTFPDACLLSIDYVGTRFALITELL